MFKMNKKWILSLVLMLAVSLVVVGCTNDADDPDTVDPAVEEDLDEAADDLDEATDDIEDAADDAATDLEDEVRDMAYEDIVVTPEEAFDTFMDLHPDAKVTEIDLDKELMDYQYVVEGYDTENSYEVKINPVDGTIISDDEELFDSDDDEMAEITKDHLAKVDSIIDKAIIEDGSDSELDEWNISVDDGKVIMDVEIGMTEYSYDMDTEELVERDM